MSQDDPKPSPESEINTFEDITAGEDARQCIVFTRYTGRAMHVRHLKTATKSAFISGEMLDDTVQQLSRDSRNSASSPDPDTSTPHSGQEKDLSAENKPENMRNGRP